MTGGYVRSPPPQPPPVNPVTMYVHSVSCYFAITHTHTSSGADGPSVIQIKEANEGGLVMWCDRVRRTQAGANAAGEAVGRAAPESEERGRSSLICISSSFADEQREADRRAAGGFSHSLSPRGRRLTGRGGGGVEEAFDIRSNPRSVSFLCLRNRRGRRKNAPL